MQKGEAVPLVLLDEPSPFRNMVLNVFNEADIPWCMDYVASTLSAVKAAVQAGLARPVKMMSPDLRVLSCREDFPPLPETQYLLSRNPKKVEVDWRRRFSRP